MTGLNIKFYSQGSIDLTPTTLQFLSKDKQTQSNRTQSVGGISGILNIYRMCRHVDSIGGVRCMGYTNQHD